VTPATGTMSTHTVETSVIPATGTMSTHTVEKSACPIVWTNTQVFTARLGCDAWRTDCEADSQTKCPVQQQQQSIQTRDHWELLKSTGNYWGDYWRLLEITGVY